MNGCAIVWTAFSFGGGVFIQTALQISKQYNGYTYGKMHFKKKYISAIIIQYLEYFRKNEKRKMFQFLNIYDFPLKMSMLLAIKNKVKWKEDAQAR